jgi:glutamyl-tRNA reductase
MTGLDHKRADLGVREKFAIPKERTQRILAFIKNSGIAGGFVIVSTCNRTEFYASVNDIHMFNPAKILCSALDRNFSDFEHYFIERTGENVIKHLCLVASGLGSQIMGEDQIITQVREALELSRRQSCTDSYTETLFRLAIQAGKVIKTNVNFKSGTISVPIKTVDKLKTLCPLLAGRNAVVIGNGWMGRLVSQLLINENVNVTVTIRENKKGDIQVPDRADTIRYNERYKAIEQADIVISATTSPHFTLRYNELSALARLPEIIVDLAVPRDIEPLVQTIPEVLLLTIDDISGESQTLPPESILKIDEIIKEHIEKYYQWFDFKKNAISNLAGANE